MRVIEVTLGSGATQILIPNQQAPMANVAVSLLVVQKNSTNSVTLGDNTVTDTKGIVIAAGTPGTPLILQFSQPRGSLLSQYWLFGTSGDKVEVMYETAQ